MVRSAARSWTGKLWCMSVPLGYHCDLGPTLSVAPLKLETHWYLYRYIWGRGAMDVKFSVTALLEAATSMMQEGLTPRRTVFLAFGHDEEVGGRKGHA